MCETAWAARRIADAAEQVGDGNLEETGVGACVRRRPKRRNTSPKNE